MSRYLGAGSRNRFRKLGELSLRSAAAEQEGGTSEHLPGDLHTELVGQLKYSFGSWTVLICCAIPIVGNVHIAYLAPVFADRMLPDN